MYSWSSPAIWSFGSGDRVDELKGKSNTLAPGPGAYDETIQKTYKKAYPSWKVGNSQRPNLYSSSNPQVGPGRYEIGKKETKKYESKTMPKGPRGHSEVRGVAAVGPGSYESRTYVGTAPTYSFGYKGEGFAADRAKTPGPGAYEITNMFDDALKKSQMSPNTKSAFIRTAPHAMTHSKDPETGKNGVPGPGAHYNPDVENYDFRYFKPTWSFGKATRDDLYNDEAMHVPGPGKYQIPGTIKNNKFGFTILGKNQTKKDGNDVPAPNAYNQKIDPLRQTAPAFRIGKSERKGMATGDKAVPGPGAYERGSQLDSKGAKIGTSQRPGLYTNAQTPAPGAYEANSSIGNSAKYSMGLKSQGKKMVDIMPGPGEYEPFGSLYLEKSIGAVIGESQRPPLYKKGAAPGPGQYDIRGNIGSSMAPKSRFGTGRRVPIAKVNDEPGPGYYNIPSAIGNVPRFQQPGFTNSYREGYDLSQSRDSKRRTHSRM